MPTDPNPIYYATEVDALLDAQEQQDRSANDQLAAMLQAQIDIINAKITPPVTNPPVTPPAAAKSRQVWLGASDLTQFPGITAFGSHRTFYGLDGSSGGPQLMLTTAKTDAQLQRMSVVSIDRGKGSSSGWGTPDPNKLAAYGPALVANPHTRTILHHEPENDFKKPADGAVLTDAQNVTGYQAWYTAAAKWMRANYPHVPIGPCLMAWTFRPNGGPGGDHWLGAIDRSLIDFLAVDGYANPGDPAPNPNLVNAYAYAVKLGVPLIIAETGQEQTADQVAWMKGLLSWAATVSKANPKSPIEAICWWPGTGPNGDYHPNPALMSSVTGILTSPQTSLA